MSFSCLAEIAGKMPSPWDPSRDSARALERVDTIIAPFVSTAERTQQSGNRPGLEVKSSCREAESESRLGTEW